MVLFLNKNRQYDSVGFLRVAEPVYLPPIYQSSLFHLPKEILSSHHVIWHCQALN